MNSKLLSLVQRMQVPDRPKANSGYAGPRVAVIHGFMARRLMQRNLLRYLRSKGLSDVTMYGHLHSVDSISDELQASHREGRKLVILGYSQGGFHAVKFARELERRGVDVALLVSIAAGTREGGSLVVTNLQALVLFAVNEREHVSKTVSI